MNVSEESSSMLRVNRGRGGEGSGVFFFSEILNSMLLSDSALSTWFSP